MKNLFLAFLAAMTLLIASAAVAEETAQKPETTTQPWAKWSLGLKFGGTIAFPDGKATPKPMGIGFGANMTNPIGDKWGWGTEIGAGSPATVFNPAPYISTGPVFTVVAKKLVLSPWVLYQYNSGIYKAAKGKTTHYVGGGITPVVPISDTIAIGLPIGAGQTIGGPEAVWQWNIGPKLILRLPY